jgi:hypothetical protein
MVGYNPDAIVESKIRVRFDVGLHDDRPDRAEFFYAKCGCYRDNLQPPDPAFDPNAPGPGPDIPNDLDFQQVYVQGEYAINDRFSVFGEFPLRWIQPNGFVGNATGFGNQAGVSDLRAGVKFALLSDPTQVLTVQIQTFLPTGDARKGLGTDHFTLEPSLLFYRRLADRAALESSAGVWIPTNGSAGVPTSSSDKFSGSVFFYGIGPSYEVYRTDRLRLAPVVELVGWHVLGGFETPPPGTDASGTNVVNLKLGARTIWNDRDSFYVGWGHGLTDATWYHNIVRFEYRHAF